MSRVRRMRDGSVGLRVEPQEASVLRELVAQFAGLVESGRAAPSAPLHDPALARLFPAAYAEPEAQARFRREHGPDAADRRLADAASILAVLDRQEAGGRDADRVPPAELAGVVRGLNAFRLVLSARLEVLTEDDAAAVRSDEPIGAIYQWLGILLEQIMAAMR